MYIGCHGGLAQLVEQLIYTEKVTGSSPVSPTDFKEQSDCTKKNSHKKWEIFDYRLQNYSLAPYLLFPKRLSSFKNRFTKSRYKVSAPMIDSL